MTLREAWRFLLEYALIWLCPDLYVDAVRGEMVRSYEDAMKRSR